jgi:hypothetical protein
MNSILKEKLNINTLIYVFIFSNSKDFTSFQTENFSELLISGFSLNISYIRFLKLLKRYEKESREFHNLIREY